MGVSTADGIFISLNSGGNPSMKMFGLEKSQVLLVLLLRSSVKPKGVLEGYIAVEDNNAWVKSLELGKLNSVYVPPIISA